MKLRVICLSAAAAIILASCGASKITAEPIAITPSVATKKVPLTEAQEKRWSDLDIVKDSVPGMSVDRAYELLKGRKSKKVIVGVVDSGIDINHPELSPVIWKNTKEVPNNAKDDDNNGYVDDVNGWNFLGDAENENLEFVRILKKGDNGSPEYKKAKSKYDKDTQEAKIELQKINYIINASNKIKAELKKDSYTVQDLNNLKSSDPLVNELKPYFTQVLAQIPIEELDKELKEAKDHFENELEYNLNLKFDGRKIVGDNPDDFNDRNYGNNNVIGPKAEGALHGTHVAGIIAQTRGNDVGGDGVASNVVEIMPVRAVPDGDEYDKDVALAIRYAVDNGAKVINGSFGKYFSTHSEWVYDAIKYAADKDVLIVCAAGNEGMNLNKNGKTVARYPNDSKLTGNEIADNFICIGALNPVYGENMVASFSNYGQKEVDIFSPGVRIYATTPNNSYQFLQGTSMASPNAAGVAALIRAYYPKLTAAQVKKIIMDSGVAINLTVNVGEEEDEDTIPFSKTCVTGKIVNAYNAIILADKVSRGK